MQATTTTVLLLSFAVAFAGCRDVRPEAGLPAFEFQAPMPHVTSNDRGFWFLIAEGGAKRTGWVVLEDESSHLFRAVPQGDRTSRLLPVTPFAYRALDSHRGKPWNIRWVESPATAETGHTVGWAPSSDAKSVAWAGTPPEDRSSAVLLDTDDASGSRWIDGLAIVEAQKFAPTTLREGAVGPFVVMVEPGYGSGPLRVGTLVDVEGDFEPAQLRRLEAQGQGSPNRFAIQPVGAREAVDVVVSAGATEGFLALTFTAPVVVNGLPLGLSVDTFEVPQGKLDLALRGAAALRDGRFLAAAFLLGQADIHSGDSSYGGELRVAELFAAAGFVDWMRSALLTDAKGLDADAALYLARGHFLGGDYQRAVDFAERANQRFRSWPTPGSELGRAEASTLLARLAAKEGERDAALDHALTAAERFASAGDEMRAAEAELRAATYALEAMNARQAVKLGLVARSRYFHGKAPYWSGFAEIALSDIYRQVGEVGEARKMSRFAALRFEGMNHEGARNRAGIAEGRVLLETAQTAGKRDLEFAFNRATKNADPVGVVDAAASLVVAGLVGEDELAKYGSLIASQMRHVDEPSTTVRAVQALSILCAQGLSESVGACGDLTAGTDDSMVAPLVTQGWAALSDGATESASKLATRAAAAAGEETRSTAPRLAVDVLLLQAAVQQASGSPNVAETISDAVALLRKTTDPTRLAATFAEFGERMAGRGQSLLAASLMAEAVQAADEQGQTELRRSFALDRVRVLHEAGAYAEMLEASRKAEPILETAGPASSVLLARLWTYHADALHRLNRQADAALVADKAARAAAQADGLAQIELTLFAAQLAVERGDINELKLLQGRAEAAETILPSALSDDPRRRLVKAQIQSLRGDIATSEGRIGPAHKAYLAATASLAGLPTTGQVLRTRLRALAGAGLSAPNSEAIASVLAQLEELRASARAEAPALTPLATSSIAKLELDAGRPGRALELIDEAKSAGGTFAANATDAVCLEGRAASLSGRKGAASMLATCAERTSGAQHVDAALLATLTDRAKKPADHQRTVRELLATHGESVEKRQRERLGLVSELYVGTTRRDERREAKLSKTLAAAKERGDARTVARTTEELAGVLLGAGQAAEAGRVVDARSSAFYETGDSGPGQLARLRTETTLASLDALATFNFAARAISEADDMTPEDAALTAFAAAKNAVLLGMWQHARSLLQDASVSAGEAKNRRLARRIQEFAQRFELPLTD